MKPAARCVQRLWLNRESSRLQRVSLMKSSRTIQTLLIIGSCAVRSKPWRTNGTSRLHRTTKHWRSLRQLTRRGLGALRFIWRAAISTALKPISRRGSTSRSRTIVVRPRRQCGRGGISDARILVQGEQGYGDLFQFCRFVPMLARRGAKVVLHERPETFSLLKSVAGVENFIPNDAEPPATDWRVHLWDIMHALGVGPNDVGESAPYLSADAEHASRWRQRLGERSSPRIGVCWRGRTTNAVERMRSLHRTALERLLSHDAEFVSLQFEAGEDAVLLAAHGVADFGRDIADFAELAALIEVLDLVVTIDTGVAHLAGALGKPVWIMLPYAADWRWMKARADSPWYPSARLFRQTKPGDWNSVVDAVAAQLPK